MQQENREPEVTGIVNRICDILAAHGRLPEVYAGRWYDIQVHSSSIDEVSENPFYQDVRSLAGDYFGEFFWAHSVQHIYIWFDKQPKKNKTYEED